VLTPEPEHGNALVARPADLSYDAHDSQLLSRNTKGDILTAASPTNEALEERNNADEEEDIPAVVGHAMSSSLRSVLQAATSGEPEQQTRLRPGPVVSRAADPVSVANTTDADPVTLSRRLSASLQLFRSMRDASSVYNVWAGSSPVAVAQMLNPAPGSPPLVNVDVIAGNCLQGVKVSRAVGDWMLAKNGLLAAFASLSAPRGSDGSMAPVRDTNSLCSLLSAGDVAGTFVYHLVCNAWLRGNGVVIPLPSGLSCSQGAMQFSAALKTATCMDIMGKVESMGLNNAFFTPYNTTFSQTAKPTVYAANGPSNTVTATTAPASAASSSTPSPALNTAALAALNALPHLAALNYYAQAGELNALCINFDVITALITQLGSGGGATNGGGGWSGNGGSGGNGGTGSGGMTLSTAASPGYYASGLMIGLVSVGGFGMLLLTQLLLFVTMVGAAAAWKACALRRHVKKQQQQRADAAAAAAGVPKDKQQNKNSKAAIPLRPLR
jgi:hypothetical protein